MITMINQKNQKGTITMDNVQELREIVNPVFNTAKSCIQLDAAAGDADSAQLLGALGFGSIADQKESKGVRGFHRSWQRR